MVPTLPGKRRQQRHSTHLPRLHSKNTAEPGFIPTLSAQFPMLWTIWAGLPQRRIFYLLLMTKGVGPTCPLRPKDPLVICYISSLIRSTPSSPSSPNSGFSKLCTCCSLRRSSREGSHNPLYAPAVPHSSPSSTIHYFLLTLGTHVCLPRVCDLLQGDGSGSSTTSPCMLTAGLQWAGPQSFGTNECAMTNVFKAKAKPNSRLRGLPQIDSGPLRVGRRTWEGFMCPF